MPYDASLDKQIFTKYFEGPDGSRVVVSVYSYNNGPKKLQISRENMDAEGNSRFAKLGRMTKEEAQGALPIIEEALAHLG